MVYLFGFLLPEACFLGYRHYTLSKTAKAAGALPIGGRSGRGAGDAGAVVVDGALGEETYSTL